MPAPGAGPYNKGMLTRHLLTAALLITGAALAPATAAAADQPPVQYLISNDTLYVGATDADDLLLFAPGDNDPSIVKLNLGGDATWEYAFDATQFHTIDVDSEGGNDKILLTTLKQTSFLRGGTGNDTISGGNGADHIDGGGGHDHLWAGSTGTDVLVGGPGIDWLGFGAWDGGTVTADGGPDNDTLSVQGGPAADTIELLPGVAAGTVDVRYGGVQAGILRETTYQTAATFTGLETAALQLGDGDDTFTAGDGLKSVVEVRVNGGPGRDTLIGGDGDDVIAGGPGLDQLDGRGGADTYQCGGPGDWFVEGPGDIVSQDCR